MRKFDGTDHLVMACHTCRTPAWLVLLWERLEFGYLVPSGGNRFAVRCDNCITLGPWGPSKNHAVIAWNGEIEIQRRASATAKRRAAR